MTLTPEKIGDKGQRFEVRAMGYPNDGSNVIGWTNDAERAEVMMKSIRKAPRCTCAWIVDRKPADEIEDAA